jgi:hypothetical protein
VVFWNCSDGVVFGTVPKYHTIGTVPNYHTIGTVPKYHTIGTVPKYHTIGTVPKPIRKFVEIGMPTVGDLG